LREWGGGWDAIDRVALERMIAGERSAATQASFER